MQETDLTNKTRAGEYTEDEHPVRRLRILDIAVLAFIAFTLVLMPLLAGGSTNDQATGTAESFSAGQREALAESRGDAAASAAAENAASANAGANAANGPESAVQMIGGADGRPVDQQTRDAIDEASRGDAVARGSVASDYNEAGGRN